MVVKLLSGAKRNFTFAEMSMDANLSTFCRTTSPSVIPRLALVSSAKQECQHSPTRQCSAHDNSEKDTAKGRSMFLFRPARNTTAMLSQKLSGLTG